MSNAIYMSQDNQQQKDYLEGYRSSISCVPCLLYGHLKCLNTYKNCAQQLHLDELSCILNDSRKKTHVEWERKSIHSSSDSKILFLSETF